MKFLIANWKMHPKNEAQAVALAKAEDFKGVIICPPFPFLSAVRKVLKRAALGSQDVFYKKEGAFTGEVSPLQLKSFGVKYVIIGHSERRLFSGETNELVAQKIAAAMENGLTPILCVGETKEQRETGQTKEILDKQLRLGLSLVRMRMLKKPLLIAYEPIWSISTFGSGSNDSASDASDMINYIRSATADLPRKPRVIYGGSVNSGDIAAFLKEKAIKGSLVGSASLNAKEFKQMYQTINH